MDDQRPLQSVEEAVAAVRAEMEDRISTILARLHRRPVGDIELAVRGSAKPGTLVLAGQPVSRETYADLWKWANDQGLVTGGLFTTGDGSTTFGLPDFRGRVPRGVAAGETVGQLLGADSRTLTTSQLPAHDHNVSGSGTAASAGTHSHSGTADTAGSHGGHFPGSQFNADYSGGVALGLAAWNSGGSSNGSHSHSVDLNDAGGHTHSVSLSINETSVGNGAPLDMRQASIAVQWLIWT